MNRIWTPLFSPPFPKDISELSIAALKIISFLECQEFRNHNLRIPSTAPCNDLNQLVFYPQPTVDRTEEKAPFSLISNSELRPFEERIEYNDVESTEDFNNKNQKNHPGFPQSPNFETCGNNSIEKTLMVGEKNNSNVDKSDSSKCYSIYFSDNQYSRNQVNNYSLNQSVDMFEDSETLGNEPLVSHCYKTESCKSPPSRVKKKKKHSQNKKITNYFPLTKIESIKKLDLYMPQASTTFGFKKNTQEISTCYNEPPSRVQKVPLVINTVEIDNSCKQKEIISTEKNEINSVEKGRKKKEIKSPISKGTKHLLDASNSFSHPESHLNVEKTCPEFIINKNLYEKSKAEDLDIEENFRHSQNTSIYDVNESYQILSCKVDLWDSGSEMIYAAKEDSELIFSLLTSNSLSEIGMTLCYREGFCLLNKNHRTNCTPKDILLCAKYLDGTIKFMNFAEECLQHSSYRNILLHVLRSFTRKICFEAQALILFILDNMEMNDARDSYDWCILDPLIGGWLLDPDHPPSLFEDLRKRYLNQEIPSSNNWLKECGNLLLQQSQVMELLYGQLMKENIWDVFLYLETKIIPILAVLETSEIVIDTEKVRNMSLLLNVKLKTLEKEAEILIGHKISLNSTEQLRKVLYEELKLDGIGNVKIKGTSIKGVKSTSESMLKLLVNVHPLPKLILEYRQLFKLKSAYTDVLLEHTKGKNSISAMWDLCSTATGRVTSSNPNLQNIPKQNIYLKIGNEEKTLNLRSCFVARENSLLVSADFQHIELRVFAMLAKDRALLGLLRKRGDIFSIMTEIRLNKEEITTEERTQTKTLVYALMYGAGAKRIADILSLDLKEAESVRDKFLGIFPGLQEFNRKVLREVRKNSFLKSISGRKRMFPNISSMNLVQRKYSERQAINFIIQGSAADICKGAMLRIEQVLKEKKLNTKLLLQIHDELLWEVRNSELPIFQDNAADICKGAMLRIEQVLKEKKLNTKLLLQIHDELLWEVRNSELPIFQEIVKESMEANRCFWVAKMNIDIPLPIVITTGKDWGTME